MSKVTVVGAGKYGSTTAMRLAEADIADEVVMTDIVEGLPQGLALDMNQSRSLLGYRSLVVGSNDYADTAGSDVVVITAGLPRKPGMSRMDLLAVNARIVKEVTIEITRYSPDAVIINVTNPLDHMTTLVADVSGFPRDRVMGSCWPSRRWWTLRSWISFLSCRPTSCGGRLSATRRVGCWDPIALLPEASRRARLASGHCGGGRARWRS